MSSGWCDGLSASPGGHRPLVRGQAHTAPRPEVIFTGAFQQLA